MNFTSLKLLAEMIIQTIITSIQDQRALPVRSRKDDLSRQQPVSIGLHSQKKMLQSATKLHFLHKGFLLRFAYCLLRINLTTSSK